MLLHGIVSKSDQIAAAHYGYLFLMFKTVVGVPVFAPSLWPYTVKKISSAPDAYLALPGSTLGRVQKPSKTERFQNTAIFGCFWTFSFKRMQ